MPGLENKIDKNMRFAKCLQMESYLDEIFEKGKEIFLFKKFLAKDLVETIDWRTFTRLDNKETRSFEFTGFVYRCKINGLPADLIVAITDNSIRYPNVILSLLERSLDWMRICVRNGYSKFPVVIPMAFYYGSDDVSYPADNNIGIWEHFENPSFAQHIWSIKPICLVDLSGLPDEEINSLYLLKTAHAVPSLQDEVRTISQQFEQRGRLDERFAIAKSLLAAGIQPELVKQTTQLSEEELSCLQGQLRKNMRSMGEQTVLGGMDTATPSNIGTNQLDLSHGPDTK